MKKQIVYIACIAATLSSLNAASVAITNVGTSPLTSLAIAYNGTTTAATGGIAAGGYFLTLTDAQVITLSTTLNVTNMASLVSDFQVVVSTTLDSAFGGGVPNGGLFNASNGSVTLPNATHSGKGLYTFAGNATTLGASTQWVLWDHPAVIDAQDTIAQPDSNSLLMAQEGSKLIGGDVVNVNVDFTSIGGGPAVIPGIQLAAIPEPSAALLGAISALGLLRRRRN